MIQRVYEQVTSTAGISDVWVATDNEQIFETVERFGGKAIMTNPDHPSGTDRVCEAYLKTGVEADLIINVQGDEPYIKPEQIEELIGIFKKSDADIGTLVKPIHSSEELLNPNKVKAVVNKNGKALYFSRLPIPFFKGLEPEEQVKKHTYLKHIGMYAFKPACLKELVTLPTSSLENAESLEQLRWLENGYAIYTETTHFEAHAIDTPEDLALLLKQLN